LDAVRFLQLFVQYLKYFAYVNLNRLSPFPLIIFIETTKRCNLRCVQCDIWKVGEIEEQNGTYELSLSDIKAIGNEAARYGSIIIQLYGGEPLLRNDILDIIGEIHSLGIKIGLTTNGVLLKPEVIDNLVDAGLARLILSIDHSNPDIHNELRGEPGLLENIIECIRYVRTRYPHSKLQLEGSTVVHRRNFDNLVEISGMLHELGIRTHNINPIMHYYPLKMNALSKEDEDGLFFRREDLPALDLEINRFYDHLKSMRMNTTTTQRVLKKAIDYYGGRHEDYICAIGGVTCDIMANGDVLLCWGSETPVGNIREDSLYNIWHSRKSRRIKEDLLHCTRCVDSCQADMRMRFSPRFIIGQFPDLIREVYESLF